MNILVSGLINIETSIPVRQFPINYYPVDYLFGGIESCVSGVGFNIAKALSVLGDTIDMVSLIGNDFYGSFAIKELKGCGINTRLVKKQLSRTCHSVVMYDPHGDRLIYCDLKDVQEKSYIQNADKALMRSDIALLCNINFSRPLLSRARQLGIPIATDCHVLSDINDDFNVEFMRYADILFLSNEAIKGTEHIFIQKLSEAYDSKIIIIGMGKEGALLYDRSINRIRHYPAKRAEDIPYTSGAGDALFASFVHFYAKTKNAEKSLHYAQVFAFNKIHSKLSSSGFLTEEELLKRL
ncbi:MAG: carbohydrate kinase family protein [Clostridia bacterium]|nr:carbohydrate kinase family protein [Clostridia bacterium]